MDPRTPTSEEGDHSNALKGQPWQSLQPAKPIVDGSSAANSDRCFKCHELGHGAKHCPLANVRAQCNEAQAGDQGAYISQPTMDPQTLTSEGGDYSSALRGQPWPPFQPGNPIGDGSPAANSDRCFRCHELGHWAKHCPSVNIRAQFNAAQAGYMSASNSQPRMDPQTPSSEGDYLNVLRGPPWQSFQPGNPIGDSSPAANSDRCFRCHELGHWAKHCPSVNVRAQFNAAQAGYMSASNSQPRMDPQTPSSEGDYLNVLRGPPWQSFQSGNPIGDSSPAANSDRCFRCHELGHWAKHCPSVNVRAQFNAAQAGYMSASNSQPRMDPQTPGSEGDYLNVLRGPPWQSFQPGNPIGDSSPAANSDRCFRCHELGHWAKHCPSVNVRAQFNAAQAGYMSASNSQLTMDLQAPTFEGHYSNALRGQLWQSFQPGNPIGEGSPAAKSDRCFKCHELGHWVKDFPSVNVRPQCNVAQSEDRGAYSIPEKFCLCGRGACLILTSHTQANPGRKFYKCPGREGADQCRFFQWCDAPVSSPRQNSPGRGGEFKGQSAIPTQVSPVPAGGGFSGQSAAPTQISPVTGRREFRGQPASPTHNSPAAGGFRGQSATFPNNSTGGRGCREQSPTPGNNSNGVGIVNGYDYSTRCPCGAGPCPVRTAGTVKNMGRQFVTCPVRKQGKRFVEAIKHI